MLSIFDFPDVYDAVLRSPLPQIEVEAESVRKLLADRGSRIAASSEDASSKSLAEPARTASSSPARASTWPGST